MTEPDLPDGGPTDPGQELVEVVASDGSVTGTVTRSKMRAERLRHRCTYIAVVVGADGSLGRSVGPGVLHAESEIVVHQRADWKDTCPSYWDLAFGGVCSVGEDWEWSAKRELAEEAGIVGPDLVDLGPSSYEDDTNCVIGRVYIAAWSEDPVCVDGEVVALDRVPLGRLQSWAEDRLVCPDSLAVVLPRLIELLP